MLYLKSSLTPNEAYGFYTYEDFYLFGQGLGIKASRVEKLIEAFVVEKELVKVLIEQSFLKEEIKDEYLNLYRDKLKRIGMRL